MILDDEGRNGGRRYLPRPLSDHFQKASVILLEIPLDQRIQITFDEYVTAAQLTYCVQLGNDGPRQWLTDLLDSLQRIRKRLGGERLQRISRQMQQAFELQQTTGDCNDHKEWIEVLLREYYDPMYDYQLKQKQKKIILTGDAAAVRDYLNDLN
jgi:tRNA 2-selenouridine synthase